MFIELAEFLRCPADHPETHCVLAPLAIAGRDVVSGIVGCPACRSEYRIEHGVAQFGEPPGRHPAPGPLPQPEVVQALLGIATPGGYVVLIGSAAALASDLARLMSGVHLVAVNAPVSLERGPAVSLLTGHAAVPLRKAMARGVVLGKEFATSPWTEEAARVLLPGLQLVVLSDRVAIDGTETLATENGMWVGRKARSEK